MKKTFLVQKSFAQKPTEAKASGAKSEEKRRKRKVELFPYGITYGPDELRPVMLFKDKDQKRVLPVWLNPLDAGIAVQENALHLENIKSPYHITWKILEPLGIFLKKCVFVEIKGHHQFVELYFDGHSQLKKIRCRADESVSFCLSAKCQFFCDEDFFEKCQVLDVEMSQMTQKVLENPGVLNKAHPYLN